MACAKLKEEVKRWMLGTSMKGMPKVVKSDTSCLRIMWLIAVLVFLGVTTHNVTLLVISYLQYGSHTVISTRLSDQDDLKHLLINSPEFTVCNLNPISSEADLDHLDTSPEKFRAMWNDFYSTYIENGEIHRTRYGHLAAFLQDWTPTQISKEGYSRHIGLNASRHVGHKEAEFIVACHILVRSPLGVMHVPCSITTTIERETVQGYYNCYRTHYTKPENITGYPVGIDFELYLDEVPKRMKWTASESGAAIFLTHNNSLPNLQKRVLISPGTSADIRYSLSERIRLGPPHGNCIRNDERPIRLFDLDGKEVAYSELACIIGCDNAHVEERCGCFPVGGVRAGGYDPTLPPCGSLVDGPEALLQRIDCALFNSSGPHCIEMCQPPCREFRYTVKESSSRWPVLKGHLEYYDEVIRRKSYAEKFSVYRDILERRKNVLDEEETEELLRNTKLIEDNFVKVTAYVTDTTITLLEDRPDTSPAALMSQVGGSLNIFSGITFMILVEFMEVVYRLIRPYMQRANVQPTVDLPRDDKNAAVIVATTKTHWI